MDMNYQVGQKHRFIRIDAPLHTLPAHTNDLLHPDIDRLGRMHTIEAVEIVNLLCYSHTYDENEHHCFHFRNDRGRVWVSAPQEAKDRVDWRIIGSAGAYTYTNYDAVIAYVLRIVRDDERKYPMWASDRARIFLDHLGQLLKQTHPSDSWKRITLPTAQHPQRIEMHA